MPTSITKTLRVLNTIGGVPKDYDEVPVLSDADATYGLRRSDTLVEVLPAGTAYTRISEGNYRLDVEVEPGVSYEYNVRRVRGVLVQHSYRTFVSATVVPGGLYGNK